MFRHEEKTTGFLATITTALTLMLAAPALAGTFVGADVNNEANPFVQPQDPALSGGDIDQSLQNADILIGTRRADLMIGRIGEDILAAGSGNDVILGGTEHFGAPNRDKAFGDKGHDVFIWAPGDGSDYFNGGRGSDAVVFGLVGEIEDGQVVFRVSNDGQAGEVFRDPATGLPVTDVTNSPGFCPVIDGSTPENADSLAALGLDHLVQFVIRGIRNSFEDGTQSDDNGLRVTLHLDDVEYLVCASRDGGAIEILDLRQQPPAPIQLHDIASPSLRWRLAAIVR